MLPFPYSLSNQIFPPCISTIRFVRASPSPVPSYFREKELSACQNSLNTFCWSSGFMPIPVSETEICSISSTMPVSINIFPFSPVNFIAFDNKLYSICLNLTRSASMAPTSVSIRVFSSRCFLPASPFNMVYTSSIDCGTRKVSYCSSIFPASTLDKSSMSLIIWRRCCPLLWISLTKSTCSSFKSPAILSRSTSAKPMMALRGVRNSCDMLARNSDFILFACSRARMAFCKWEVFSAMRCSRVAYIDCNLVDMALNALPSRPTSSRDVISTFVVRLPVSVTAVTAFVSSSIGRIKLLVVIKTMTTTSIMLVAPRITKKRMFAANRCSAISFGMITLIAPRNSPAL